MSEGLAQAPYVVARVGFEPATFRTQGTKLIALKSLVSGTSVMTLYGSIILLTVQF